MEKKLLKNLFRSVALLLFVFVHVALGNAQTAETHFAIETEVNGAPAWFENNFGVLRFNTDTDELSFSTNLANLKTGDKKLDSLLTEQDQISFVFTSTLAKNFFDVVKLESIDNTYQIAGTISVNNNTYRAEAFIGVKNFTYKADLSKALFNIRLEVNPKIIDIPVLSARFDNPLVFIVVDEQVNKFRE